MSKGFARPEGPEEITPEPLATQSSFSSAPHTVRYRSDSLSAAKVLLSDLPTAQSAALGLHMVAESPADDSAIVCLMSLSAASQVAGLTRKRKAGDDAKQAGAPRRKLRYVPCHFHTPPRPTRPWPARPAQLSVHTSTHTSFNTSAYTHL